VIVFRRGADVSTKYAKVTGGTGLVSHERLDTRSVIPAKAGIQATFFWIPAFAGKTIVARGCSTIPPM
jgi:hypothetical protein